MDFPIQHLMSEEQCYAQVLAWFHPCGLHCPRCQAAGNFRVCHRHRDPVIDYTCSECGCYFNIWTGTPFEGTHRTPVQVVLIIRGILKGDPSAQIARELGISRSHLTELRHKLQEFAFFNRDRSPLPDSNVEADEMYQNAGEKGIPHNDPDDPPRCRANNARGQGTMDNDRPPVIGVIGRDSGGAHFDVISNANQQQCEREVLTSTQTDATVNSDESAAYNQLENLGHPHRTVCHSRGEYARDDDGDGVREVHCNTCEGTWTGLRNYLRKFRGVSKHYLHQYVAIFELHHNYKRVCGDIVRALIGFNPLVYPCQQHRACLS